MTDLLELHRIMSRRIGYDERKRRFQAYHSAVKPVCDRLPFKWKIVGVDNPWNNHNGFCYGADHIVLEEEIAIGRLKREKGDALCKKAAKFNGNLWVDPHSESVVTCKACLKKVLQIIGQSELVSR